MHDIICFGSATMDVFVETEKNTSALQEIDGTPRQFITYRSGEKILVSSLHFEIGGGGTNTAVCFAKLGLKTGYAGCVGNDVNGELVLQKLAEEKVDFLGTRIDGFTNYSIVLDSTLIKDRTILVYKGASEYLSYENLPAMQSPWMYVSSLSGESFETAKRLISEFRQAGGKVACNPSNYQIEHDKAAVLELLKDTTILVLNRDEAALLVNEETDEELVQKLLTFGPSIVVVTMGSNGVVAGDGQNIYSAMPEIGLNVKETTGAGDCFAATFTSAIILGKPVEMAIRWAFINVENHIKHIGAKAGLLTRAEIESAVVKDIRNVNTKKL